PSARHVRHLLYRCYQELHPEFEIPDEVFKARTITTTREEQFISQRIMKSGMKAATSALKFEQDNERKRRNSPEEGSGTFDRLRGINREGGTTNPRNQRVTSSKVQQVSSSKVQKVSSSKVQKVTGNRDDARNSKGSLRSVRDLKKTEERGIFSKLFGWLGGRKD
ncbi:MAG TPA: hypothetical protein PKN86_16615, partial [Candidatus Obscuribacter sp.]|nr:hypothetical protein [Candidatus Obscuribacter sp.]